MNGWASQSVSFAGRLELLKTVLFGNIAYWYQTFEFHVSISNEIERIFVNFLWNNRMQTISWVDVCKPKKEGGFVIRRINDLCKAAGLKMIWRLLNSNSLWSSWMNIKYLKGRSFWESSSQPLDSGTWKVMAGLKLDAQSCMMKKIRNGCETSLWYDP